MAWLSAEREGFLVYKTTSSATQSRGLLKMCPICDCVACWLILQMGYLPLPSPAHFGFDEFEHDPTKRGHVDYSAA